MSDLPYPGLRPFQRHETDIFFGREEHTDQLIEKLGNTHFIAVVGPSGCGKSSLVRTGLLAGLETGFLASAGVHWRIAEFRPGNHPFLALAKALLEDKALGHDYKAPFADEAESLAFLRAALHRGPLSLHEILTESSLPQRTNLLLLVDQFEELFRYYEQTSVEKAAAFVSLLLASSEHPAIYVVITMRSDFLGDAALFYDLPQTIAQGLFLTPRLTREQLYDAIDAPATVFDGHIEADLVNQLLNDAGTDPDQLPLLQHALMRMWDIAWTENPNPVLITEQHYRKIGGLEMALSKHADEAYAELDPAQQRIAEHLFCNLTERSQGRGDTRRPVKLGEIAIQACVLWQEVISVIEVFRQPGRSFLTPPVGQELEPESIIDISHESLIRGWQRLKEWTRKEAESAELYQRLEDSAYRWEQKRAELWTGIELEIALAWRESTQPTAVWAKRYTKVAKTLQATEKEAEPAFLLAMRFLEACAVQQEEQKNQAELAKQKELKQKFKQKALIWAQIGLVIALGLALWGFYERHQAINSQKQTAQLEKERTLSLFQSHLTHAALLARDEDYAMASTILNQTPPLEAQISAPQRHARNLVAWFSQLMGDVPQQVYEGAGTQLFVIAIHPNGTELAVAGEQGSLVIFDRNTGKLTKKLQGHTDNIQAIVFDPNRQWLASAGDDKQIILWNPQNGHIITKWQTSTKVKALAVHPAGTLLASGGEDKQIKLWNPQTGKLIQTLNGHKASISTNGLAFNSTGDILGSTSHDKTARLWPLTTQSKKPLVLKGHTDILQGIAFSPDDQWVATSSVDESVRLWKVSNGKTARVLLGHQNKVFGLRFVEKGDYLITASRDRTLRIWDLDSGITLRVLQGHTAGVNDLAIHAQQLFSVSNDGTVRRWNIELPYQYSITLPSEPASAAISPDGQSVVVGFANGALRRYSLLKKQLLWEKENVHQADIQRLVFSPDGRWLATASFDNTAKLWQVLPKNLIEKQLFIGHDDAINAIAFSPKGNLLATASYDGKIGLFKVGSDEKGFHTAYQGRVYSVDFDLNGTRILSTGKDIGPKEGYTRLWQLTFGYAQIPAKPLTLIKEFPKGSDKMLWASLSSDNQKMASVGRDWLVHLYSLKNTQLHHRLVGHENSVLRAIFSPDNHQLATVSGDATVRFWDLIKRSELFTLHLPTPTDEVARLWDFDFRCIPQQNCWIAVPLTRGKLVLYEMKNIYD